MPSGIISDSYEGQLEDLAGLRRAAAGVDTIIHLAACSDDADFVTRLVPSNVIGLFHAFEAARLEGVRRFILASSCQVADLIGRSSFITVQDRYPTDNYGLTKLWAEDMGHMYARKFGLHVLAARLGWIVRSRNELEHMSAMTGGKDLFLSHNDVKEFFQCCLRSDSGPFDVVYGFSRQINGETFDMRHTRQIIGFSPEDTFPDGLDMSVLA
jgi:uronate dehydrogenase